MLRYCRLCLKNDCPMADIITLKLKTSDLDLIDSLYWIFGVEIDVNDLFSKLICERCENVVQNVGYLREAFQKNQLMLKDKREDLERVFVSKLDDLELDSLSPQTSKVPVVRVRITKLENSSEFQNYEKISEFKYRRKIRTKQTDDCTLIEKGNVTASTEIGLAVPVVCISKLECTSAVKNNVKISSEVCKRKICTEQGKKTRSIGIATEPENMYKDLIQARSTRSIGILTDIENDNRVKVSMDVFKHCMSPSLLLPKLEDSKVCEQYEKIDDITYREIRSNFDVNPDVMREEMKKLSFIDYYYNIPTTALQELIQDRYDELNGCKKSKTPLIPQLPSNNNETLIQIHDVFHVEVCTYCSKAFKTKQLLNVHYKLYHRKEMEKNNIRGIVNHRRKKKCKRKKMQGKKGLPVPGEMIDHIGLKHVPRVNDYVQTDVLIPNGLVTKMKQRLKTITDLLGIQKNKNIIMSDYDNFPNLKFLKEQGVESGNSILEKSSKVSSQSTTNLTKSSRSTGSSKTSHNTPNLTKSNQGFDIQPQTDTTSSVPIEVTELPIDRIEDSTQTPSECRLKEIAGKAGADTENIATPERNCQPQQYRKSNRLRKPNLQTISDSINFICLQEMKKKKKAVNRSRTDKHLGSLQKQAVISSRNSDSLQEVTKDRGRPMIHVTGDSNCSQQLKVSCDGSNSLSEDPQKRNVQNTVATTNSVSPQQLNITSDRPERENSRLDVQKQNVQNIATSSNSLSLQVRIGRNISKVPNITGSSGSACSQQISSDEQGPEHCRLVGPQEQNIKNIIASRKSPTLQVKIDRNISKVHGITGSNRCSQQQQKVVSDKPEPEDSQEQNVQNIVASRNSVCLEVVLDKAMSTGHSITESSGLIGSQQQISSDVLEPVNRHSEDAQEQNVQKMTKSRNSDCVQEDEKNRNRPNIHNVRSNNLFSSEQQEIGSDRPKTVKNFLPNTQQQNNTVPKNLSYLKGMADKIKKISGILSSRNSKREADLVPKEPIDLIAGDTTELRDNITPPEDDRPEDNLRSNSDATAVTEVVEDISDINEREVTQSIVSSEPDHKSEKTANTLPQESEKCENSSGNIEETSRDSFDATAVTEDVDDISDLSEEEVTESTVLSELHHKSEKTANTLPQEGEKCENSSGNIEETSRDSFDDTAVTEVVDDISDLSEEEVTESTVLSELDHKSEKPANTLPQEGEKCENSSGNIGETSRDNSDATTVTEVVDNISDISEKEVTQSTVSSELNHKREKTLPQEGEKCENTSGGIEELNEVKKITESHYNKLKNLLQLKEKYKSLTRHIDLPERAHKSEKAKKERKDNIPPMEIDGQEKTLRDTSNAAAVAKIIVDIIDISKNDVTQCIDLSELGCKSGEAKKKLKNNISPGENDAREETLRDNSTATAHVVEGICDVNEKKITQCTDSSEPDRKSEKADDTPLLKDEKCENTSRNIGGLNVTKELTESHYNKIKNLLKLKVKYKALNTSQPRSSGHTGSGITRKARLKSKTRNIPNAEKQRLKENVIEISNLMSSIQISNKDLINIDEPLKDNDSQIQTGSNVENNIAKRSNPNDDDQLEQLAQTEQSPQPKKKRKLSDLEELHPPSLNNSVQKQKVDSNVMSPSVSYDILWFPGHNPENESENGEM